MVLQNQTYMVICSLQDNLLREQKTIMAQLNEERKQLTDERAQFNLAQRLKMEQEQRDSAKTVKASETSNFPKSHLCMSLFPWGPTNL